MKFYIVDLKQVIEGELAIQEGYLGQDGTLVQNEESARQFETLASAAAHIPACDYQGCKLIYAGIELFDDEGEEEPPPSM